MNKLSQVARTVGFTAGAAAGIVGVGALAAWYRPLPRVNGTITMPGVQQAVHVFRDPWGVPHIYASCNEDLFFAQGYVHAQERLWQMELNRLTARGQLSELFGIRALDTDRFVRVLGFGRVAQREVDLLDDKTRTVVESYLLGVNTFLETHGNRLPVECTILRHQPRPWEAADILAWGKLMALSLSGDWQTKLFNARLVARLGEARARELMIWQPDDHPCTIPSPTSLPLTSGDRLLHAFHAAEFLNHDTAAPQGSNAWVVSGQRTTSGAPLLANDPHLNLTLPSIWYETHLEGGDYRVTGATFPGVPGVLIGHNDRIAWGITHGTIDVQDLYIEHIHPENPLLVAWCGEWEAVNVVHEEIYVRGQAHPITESVRITRHGPIITSIAADPESPVASDEELSLAWTALQPGNIVRAALRINTARDWESFRAALRDWNVPPQNFVYVDVDGHYGYALSGDIPIRAQGDGRLPVPGWDGEHEWTGYLSAEEMPATYDPPDGFVVSANNRIVAPDHPAAPHLYGHWLSGYRATRILDRLQAQPLHDVASFATIQQDQFSIPGTELARLVAHLSFQTPLEQQARDILVAWDGYLTADCIGGTIYSVFRYHLSRAVYADLDDLWHAQSGIGHFTALFFHTYFDLRALPTILQHIADAQRTGRSHQPTTPWPGRNQTWDGVLQHCMAVTVAELGQRFGNDPLQWQYGRFHTLTLHHAFGSSPILGPMFNRGSWPMGGDMDTLWMGYAPRHVPNLPTYTAPSYRQICTPANWDESVSLLASGQSGHPASRHYCDMAAMWRNGEYHPMLWSRSRVEQAAVATLTLLPSPAAIHPDSMHETSDETL